MRAISRRRTGIAAAAAAAVTLRTGQPKFMSMCCTPQSSTRMRVAAASACSCVP
jgi:hypothetical protein